MLIGGLDEVGYGAWAGPLISVVAVFESGVAFPTGVTDSKLTTAVQREAMWLPLIRLAKEVGIGHAWPREIDEMGVSVSLQLSYTRALAELRVQPDLLYVDGNKLVRGWSGQQIAEPKADLRYQQVSAASIIAKHFRDTIMTDYGRTYPAYNFPGNKGYGTLDHETAIHQHGLLTEGNDYLHRKLYCRKVLLRKPI